LVAGVAVEMSLLVLNLEDQVVQVVAVEQSMLLELALQEVRQHKLELAALDMVLRVVLQETKEPLAAAVAVLVQ
jgi:hypothetical protein